ncbi:hypothetical protein MD484_g5045, partial [Candolleomyces efflorescens]
MPGEQAEAGQHVGDTGVGEPMDVDDVVAPPPKPKRLVPDEDAEDLYTRWKSAIPTLVQLYLIYMNLTVVAKPVPEQTTKSPDCYLGPLSYVLVGNGLFPTAPHSPRWAVSIDLLELFLALADRSSDAVTALAAALNSTYKRRSFVILTSQGTRVCQPFRRGISYAMQWYDCLRIEVERMKEAAIAQRFNIPAQPPPPAVDPTTAATATSKGSPPATEPQAKRSRLLPPLPPPPRNAIAYCRVDVRLALAHTSKPLLTIHCRGGDIHVATDCNFNHRHIRGVANSPIFYDPAFFIPKAQVDRVGERIEAERPRAKPPKTVVPDVAIDSCRESHEAGTGSTVKTSLERFDIGGLAALVCRHDIPLFLANVDTPGEQQKYAVALIEQLMSLIPTNATVVVLYDVGCVLDRSMAKYKIFSQQIQERLLMATSVMHSYVHQWSCQLHYNPRLKPGLGLTDGENVERLWSRLRNLIGANRRILLLDRQLRLISLELRDELGNWSRRKMKNGVQSQRAEAQKSLRECGEETPFLKEQWQNQKESQLSVRAHAPNRLKKDLDKILQIQGEVQDLEQTIQKTASLVKSGSLPATCRSSLQDLQTMCTKIQEKAQQMYSALNVTNDFPSIVGVDLEFVRKLFLLRELKFQVQRRATSAFWEFDKLDQAAGGKEVPHGTKMHQTIRASMSKKTAALTSAIEHYNRDCNKLAKSRPPKCTIPVPKPLPTTLKMLKACPDLMESVWIEPVDAEKQRWVHDAGIQSGIRAVHRLERCAEETRRLGNEADNMCRWFGREISAVAEAMQDPGNLSLICFLQQDFNDLLALADTWPTALVPKLRYDDHIEKAGRSASRLTWLVIGEGETDDADELGAPGSDRLQADQVDELLVEEFAEEQLGSEAGIEERTPAANMSVPANISAVADSEVSVDCAIVAYASAPTAYAADWNAHPIVFTPLQTNGYDCGVWILACVAAVLRGKHVPFMSESEVNSFRSVLYRFSTALSVVKSD